MVYERAIVDELGRVTYWLVGMTEKEIEEVLDTHPEYRIECIEIGG